MLSWKKNSLILLCLLFACCQKIDLGDPKDTQQTTATGQGVTILGTGEGTMEYPYTVPDLRSLPSVPTEEVWVIGYLVGTAYRTMNHAEFSFEATNQTNILLSSDSLCKDTTGCIPIELPSDKWKKQLSIPHNLAHFHKCLLVKGIPSIYLNRIGLQKVSAGLWLDDFDISSVGPKDWSTIII